MLGNSNFSTAISVAALCVLLAACGAKDEKFAKRAQMERITSLIDQQKYDAVLGWYGDAQTKDQDEFRRFYAYALLGKGGFDPIKIIPSVLAPQKFSSPHRAKLFGKCDNSQLASFDSPEINCLVVRLMNQLPSSSNSYLRQGEQVLNDLAKADKLSDADHTLLLILETGMVLKNIGNILESYLYLGEKLTDEQLAYFYKQIEVSAASLETWIANMEKSPTEVSKRITGLDKVSLLEGTQGNVKFLKETGIPYVIDTIRGNSRDSKAVLSRVFFIQVIDSVTRDYFFVE